MKLNNKLLKLIMSDVVTFVRLGSGVKLRSYQREVARAVVDSVLGDMGLNFVVMFPRQSGKNELQAQIEAYLLELYCNQAVEIIKISPTWKPQSQNAMRRLQRVLSRNLLTQGDWQRESGYIYRMGQARAIFLSGAPEANIVGATASLLLEVDEAQDVQVDKYDKEIAPMAASTNATRIFWGTAWKADTLLGRELRAARQQEDADGHKRCWVLTADRVGAEVPAYRAFVDGQVARMGRDHPLVRTQFFSEEIDGQGGFLPEARLVLMQGSHAPQTRPETGRAYALLVDVAGEDGDARNLERDATAATLLEVDDTTRADPLLGLPTYRVVNRWLWRGVRHAQLYAQMRALMDSWQVGRVVIDATGVGAGLASFLERAYGRRVTRFTFNAASKSALGWGFINVVDSGRYREYLAPAPGEAARLQELFWRQCRACQMTPAAGGRIQWGVPDSARDPASGELIHDDLLISAALCWVLDGTPLALPGWTQAGGHFAADPLKDIDRGR